jgi:hypothetical protein
MTSSVMPGNARKYLNYFEHAGLQPPTSRAMMGMLQRRRSLREPFGLQCGTHSIFDSNES